MTERSRGSGRPVRLSVRGQQEPFTCIMAGRSGVGSTPASRHAIVNDERFFIDHGS